VLEFKHVICSFC